MPEDELQQQRLRQQQIEQHTMHEPVLQHQNIQQFAPQQLQQEQQNRQQEQNDYDAFILRLTMPQEIPVSQQTPPPQENMGRKERKERKKAAKKQAAADRAALNKEMTANPRLISFQEVSQLPLFATKESRENWAKTKAPKSNLTLGETLEKVRNGDYSNFENLDLVLRNMVATKALGDLEKDYQPMPDDPEVLCERIKGTGDGVSALLNPALRLGLSLAQRSDGIPPEKQEYYRKLDEAMSTAVMVATLTTKANKDTVKNLAKKENPQLNDDAAGAKADEKILANNAQQIQIAKRLLLMQLSTFSKMTEVVRDGKKTMEGTPWDKSMAVALSHCSRVVLTMPSKTKTKRAGDANSEQAHKRMWSRIFYQANGGNDAQDNSRASSTHSIARRKVSQGGAGPHTSKEKKVLFNFIGQRGMNCAIGGLGNAGVNGQLISNNGSCGHFYSMFKEASTDEHGVMLMGLESDSAGVTNQMGHTHDAHATPEKASSLGGQRTDEVGAKYGGRQCDLTHMTANDIANWMIALENKMREWQNSDAGMAGPEAARAMQMLAGKKITSPADTRWLRDTLGLGPETGGL